MTSDDLTPEPTAAPSPSPAPSKSAPKSPRKPKSAGAPPATLNKAIATALHRYIERVLPDGFDEPFEMSFIKRACATFAGVSIWGLFGMSFLATSGKTSDAATFLTRSAEDVLMILAVVLLIAVVFTVIIALSFTKGSPLKFLLHGLIVPTSVMTILKVAFLV